MSVIINYFIHLFIVYSFIHSFIPFFIYRPALYKRHTNSQTAPHAHQHFLYFSGPLNHNHQQTTSLGFSLDFYAALIPWSVRDYIKGHKFEWEAVSLEICSASWNTARMAHEPKIFLSKQRLSPYAMFTFFLYTNELWKCHFLNVKTCSCLSSCLVAQQPSNNC